MRVVVRVYMRVCICVNLCVLYICMYGKWIEVKGQVCVCGRECVYAGVYVCIYIYIYI